MHQNRQIKLLIGVLLCFLSMPRLVAQNPFQEITAEAGMGQDGRNFGIAWGDFDQDGDEDVYVSRHEAPNLLYENDGNGQFREVAKKANVHYSGNSTCSVWGDLDNDGDLDLYVGNRGEANLLYRNNGDGSFNNIAPQARVNNGGKARSVNLADIDGDGLLDIYVANLLGENALFRNLGDLRFENITQSAGASDPQISIGAIFFDYDLDGDQDLYLTHDNNQPNILYQNDGTGNFTDVSVESGTDYAGLGMGVDAGDVNQDGWPDIYITNLLDNILLLNRGDGTFENISWSAGITDKGMGWGTTFIDFNLDGKLDIYAVNDSYFSPFPNVLYQNMGDNVFQIVGENEAIASMFAGYGTACADINADGKPDLMLANVGPDGNQLFLNQWAGNENWLQVQLRGTESNYSAIGSQIWLWAGEEQWFSEIHGGSGYASQNSLIQSFGLGATAQIDSLVIRWPSGIKETYTQLSVNRKLQFVERFGEGIPIETDNLKVLPNPATTNATIVFEISESQTTAELSIFNLQGQQLFAAQPELIPGEQSIEIPLARFTPGLYFVRFETNEGKTVLKWRVE